MNNRRRLKAAIKPYTLSSEVMKLLDLELRPVSAAVSTLFQKKLLEAISKKLGGFLPQGPHPANNLNESQANRPLKLSVTPSFEQYMRPEFELKLIQCFQEAVSAAIQTAQE